MEIFAGAKQTIALLEDVGKISGKLKTSEGMAKMVDELKRLARWEWPGISEQEVELSVEDDWSEREVELMRKTVVATAKWMNYTDHELPFI